MTIPAYPLTWPAGWKRTIGGFRSTATFSKAKRRLTVYDGVARVREELGRMSISDDDLVISTNLPLRMDGWPRSDQVEPTDVGVAVYWRARVARGAPELHRVMAIDCYTRIADNLAAIAATLEAMRAIERHGGAQILERAFAGFTALPAPTGHEWWEVLSLPRDAQPDAIQAAYRRLRSEHHPDKGGDASRFAEIQAAYEKAGQR